MKFFIVLIGLVSVALSKPVEDQAIVEVASDNAGHYVYSFISKNITINEERSHDGTVKGSYTYLDDAGEKQSVSYTAGLEGFVPTGTTIPQELPEVAQARNAHLAISSSIRSLLPPLKEESGLRGAEVEEEVVPLSNEALLEAVQQLSHAQDTEEVAAIKSEFLESYKKALSL